LKEKLIDEGHAFKSDTDSEVIAHLVETFYDGDLEAAGEIDSIPPEGNLRHPGDAQRSSGSDYRCPERVAHGVGTG
jgi:hypothetical protein